MDAETGELHPKLTSGQREYDVDLARTNIIGELMDLQAGEYFPEDADPIEVGDRIRSRYDELWNELTGTELIDSSQKWKVAQRIERLNDLGFDVAELKMTSVAGSTELMIQPKVVDAGHHHRKLMRLTGMDVGEHQAQRLLNDIATYQATSGTPNMPLELAAHQWLNNAFEPVMRAVPAELKTKLEPAQIYHEFLEHRWYLGEQAGHDVPLEEAIDSYVEKILAAKRDEERFIDQTEEETTAASNPDLW